MHKLRPQAEKLRSQGYSYKMIEQQLGISRATLSYWFKDKPFTPNVEVLARVKAGPAKVGVNRHNARIAEIKSLREQGIKELGRLSARDLWLLGLGIYIGEGAKSTDSIRISNSDPAVIRLSVKWLQEALGLSKENLKITLHIYPDNDENDCIGYWSQVTGLDAQSFRQTVIDRRLNKQRIKRRRLPYGTAHLSVVSNGDRSKGVKLFRRLNGWMTGALNQV